MNLKCNPILNINIVRILIIHVVINFCSGWLLRKKRLIMDFWNDSTRFVTKRKLKMWTKKICHSSVKILNKIGHHQMEFKNEVHFFNTISFKIFNMSLFSSFFIICFPFHIENSKLSWIFLPITCLGINVRWLINICDQTHKG